MYEFILKKGRKVVCLKMQHITGISRQQLQISSLEDKIALENPVRFIDAFVENISLKDHAYAWSRTRNALHSRIQKKQ